MMNLFDHAAHGRGVRQLGNAPDAIEPEPDQRRTLRVVAADRAAGLLDLYRLSGLCPQLRKPELVRRRLGIAANATGLQRGHLDVATRRDRARRILVLQRVEGRAHHVVRVGRADRLRHHILGSERLEHCAHRAAGDDAGTGGRRTQVDATRAVTAGDVVMQGAALAQRDTGQVTLGGVSRLADRLRHLARLAVAEADSALLVADYDQRRKAEALAALDDLRPAIDVDQLVDELAVPLLALPAPFASAAFAFRCHGSFQSLIEAQPLFFNLSV